MPKPPFYEIYQMPSKDEFLVLFQKLFEASRIGNSETDTERFSFLLAEALSLSEKARKISNRDGLALDMVRTIAFYLRSLCEQKNGKWN